MPQCNVQTAATTCSVDHSVLAEIRSLQTDDEPDIIREVVAMYLADSSSRLAEIRRSISLGNLQLIQRAAHGLRGSSANLGAYPLASLCSTLEHVAEISASPALLSKIEAEFESVRAELETEADRR